MPNGVERALADSLSLEHPDVPWQPPAVPPATADLRAALAILEAEMVTTPKHIAWCLAKLMMAFEPSTKISGEETKLRAAVWAEACGDLGDALWSSATMAALQGSKWMPKPAEFRAFVAVKIEERAKKIARCKTMLSGQVQAERPKAFVAEPEADRLRHLRDSLRRVGKHGRAAMYEGKLAKLEGRPAEAWASEPQADEGPAAEVEHLPTLPLSPTSQAALDRARAEFWRKQGRTAMADRIEAEARTLAPELLGEHRGVPEAA